MRIQHKQARDTVIALNVGRFEVDADGFLKPTPTGEQWRRFADAQCYFNVVDDKPHAIEVVEATPAEAKDLAAPEATVWTPDGVQPEDLAVVVPAKVDEDEDEWESVEPVGDSAEGFHGDVEDLDAADSEEQPAYGSLTFQELKDLCKERGIGVARTSRVELISRLNAQDLGV